MVTSTQHQRFWTLGSRLKSTINHLSPHGQAPSAKQGKKNILTKG